MARLETSVNCLWGVNTLPLLSSLFFLFNMEYITHKYWNLTNIIGKGCIVKYIRGEFFMSDFSRI